MPKTKEELEPLIPPDLERCQAEIQEGSFMTLGPRPKHARCTVKPTMIATEREPGDDGRIGSMALCDGCAEVIQELMPGEVTLARIERKKPHCPEYQKRARPLDERTKTR